MPSEHSPQLQSSFRMLSEGQNVFRRLSDYSEDKVSLNLRDKKLHFVPHG